MKRAGLLLVLLCLSPALHADEYDLVKRTDSDPGFTYFPSPEDWRDINLYQIFTDRFFDGNQGNNFIRHSTENQPWYNQHGRNDEDARHLFQGGDWAGVRQKLDYLQGMGVKAIWLSGVQLNEQGVDKRFTPYHAYHPSNFYRCEPAFGTFQELKDLIDDAHSRGIYVILDVVINHTADLLQYEHLNGDTDYYCGGGCGNLVYRNGNVRFGWPFDDPGLFHNNGLINNYDAYPENQWGSFLGTDDLDTDNPNVQGKLDEIFKHLIDATDCDGFRVDAIKHVDYNWVKAWADSMRRHADGLGKDNFILFGELFSYDDAAQASFCKDDGYSFNSTLWFPMQLTLKQVFAYEQATSQLGDRLDAMHQYGEARNNLVAFLDNHDVDRIALECGSAWEAKLHPALTFMYTALPVPCLFYGTEHGFNQGERRNGPPAQGQADFQRETMWDFGWQWGNAYGDKFYASTLYNHIANLNALREEYISLRRGELVQRWEEGGKGIFAFTRTYESEEALVVINTDWGNRTCSPAVGKPDGTTYVNVLNPDETVTVNAGSLGVSVNGKESKIFVAGNARSGEVLTACDEHVLRIIYDPAQGPLNDAVPPIVASIGHDGFQEAADYEMTLVNGKWETAYATTGAVEVVNFFFKDSAGEPAYDHHDGEDWNILVAGCDGVLELAGVGHTYAWPPEGELDAGEDLWINVEAWPIGAAVGGEVVYTTDGGATWNEAPLAYNGTVGEHETWHVNMGPFELGETVQYAVVMEDPTTASLWDSNGGADYFVTVNYGTLAMTALENTYHWPEEGSINSTDDLWINTQTAPPGAGWKGTVVYSIDGGTTWNEAPLVHHATAGTVDLWNCNLGAFPPETVVQYAVRVTDTTGANHWDNNAGNDFSATVNEATSSVEWFGATRHAGIRKPAVRMAIEPDAYQLNLEALKAGAVYTLQCTSNLTEWVDVTTFTSTGPVTQYPQPLDPQATRNIYRLVANAFPLDAPVADGEDLVVQIEVYPVGGADAVNLVYSADGGATWQVEAMAGAGTAGPNDLWQVNLGRFAAGTIVRYAVEVVDTDGASHWDNNDYSDYQILVESAP